MISTEERDKYNKECLEKLSVILEQHPELRFIQALWALDIVDREDRFFEEPNITLERIEEVLRK